MELYNGKSTHAVHGRIIATDLNRGMLVEDDSGYLVWAQTQYRTVGRDCDQDAIRSELLAARQATITAK